MSLAAELRNKIYRYTIVPPVLDVTDFRNAGEPGLLAVCKQIRSEAINIYYRENNFRISITLHNPDEWLYFAGWQWRPHTLMWLQGVPRERLALVQRLEIWCDTTIGTTDDFDSLEAQFHWYLMEDRHDIHKRVFRHLKNMAYTCLKPETIVVTHPGHIHANTGGAIAAYLVQMEGALRGGALQYMRRVRPKNAELIEVGKLTLDDGYETLPMEGDRGCWLRLKHTEATG